MLRKRRSLTKSVAASRKACRSQKKTHRARRKPGEKFYTAYEILKQIQLREP